ncbi:ShlB/FhaC/HecB family hemolysin secretion/activation protein [Sphingomonas sp. KR3-1]|uniref:ShlB/FhaC/HecB family hemolysin secretion/activation protein n=1 Tax=Sphingomonas sp. KR3-1 TaxID=3156611 RepID=UPI0032B4C164
MTKGIQTMLLLAPVALASAAQAQEAPPPSPTPAAVAAAAAQPIDILEFRVRGNTRLTADQIERAVYPFEGPGRTVGDAERARAALEKAYREAGYPSVYVLIPEQDGAHGIVYLKVIESKIGAVTVAGASEGVAAKVREALPALKQGEAPNYTALTAQLIALNSRSSDRQVDIIPKPGATPETIDVDLSVKSALPLHGQFELNNQYSRDTTDLRALARLRYDDLWGLNHSIELLGNFSPRKYSESSAYSATYSLPLFSSLTRLYLTALKSDSNVATLGDTTVIGKGEQVTATFSMPLSPIGTYQQTMQFGGTWKHVDERTMFPGLETRAPITYYPVFLGYYSSIRTDTDQLSFNGSLNMAFRGLGSSDGTLDAKRFRSRGNFVYFRGSLSALHQFPFGANLWVQLEGQVASAALVQTEQFAVGGDGSVRGYLQAEGLGDNAYRTSIELRSPTLGPILGLGRSVDDLRVLGFLDAGRVWIYDPLPQQDAGLSIASAGVGLRLQLFKYLYGSLDFGIPLRTTPVTERGPKRVQFRIYSQF